MNIYNKTKPMPKLWLLDEWYLSGVIVSQQKYWSSDSNKNINIQLIWVARWVSYQKQELHTLHQELSSPPDYSVGSVLLIFLDFCVVRLFVLSFLFPCCNVRFDIRITRCSVRLYLLLFVGWRMSYLCYLCVFAYSGVQHILCCVFVFAVIVLCTLLCQFLWIVLFPLPLRYSLTFT